MPLKSLCVSKSEILVSQFLIYNLEIKYVPAYGKETWLAWLFTLNQIPFMYKGVLKVKGLLGNIINSSRPFQWIYCSSNLLVGLLAVDGGEVKVLSGYRNNVRV